MIFRIKCDSRYQLLEKGVWVRSRGDHRVTAIKRCAWPSRNRNELIPAKEISNCTFGYDLFSWIIINCIALGNTEYLCSAGTFVYFKDESYRNLILFVHHPQITTKITRDRAPRPFSIVKNWVDYRRHRSMPPVAVPRWTWLQSLKPLHWTLNISTFTNSTRHNHQLPCKPNSTNIGSTKIRVHKKFPSFVQTRHHTIFRISTTLCHCISKTHGDYIFGWGHPFVPPQPKFNLLWYLFKNTSSLS